MLNIVKSFPLTLNASIIWIKAINYKEQWSGFASVEQVNKGQIEVLYYIFAMCAFFLSNNTLFQLTFGVFQRKCNVQRSKKVVVLVVPTTKLMRRFYKIIWPTVFPGLLALAGSIVIIIQYFSMTMACKIYANFSAMS